MIAMKIKSVKYLITVSVEFHTEPPKSKYL